jgi:hypothetical protein
MSNFGWQPAKKLPIPNLLIVILGTAIIGFLCKEFIVLFLWFISFICLNACIVFANKISKLTEFLLISIAATLPLLLTGYLCYYWRYSAIDFSDFIKIGNDLHINDINDNDFYKIFFWPNIITLLFLFMKILPLSDSFIGYEEEEIWLISSLTFLLGLGLGFVLRLAV